MSVSVYEAKQCRSRCVGHVKARIMLKCPAGTMPVSVCIDGAVKDRLCALTNFEVLS